MTEAKWLVQECDDTLVHNLARKMGISHTIAHLLINRGVKSPEEAAAFLSPSLDHLHDPMLLPDMETGIERTARAIEKGEKILVHGDYDVDGVSGAALLVRTLSRLNANVMHRIPHRKRDGYDIKPYTADEAYAEGVGLIITTDCGVTACETIERAQSLGVDIVVTDHHEPGDVLPKAVAVINPRRRDSAYPFPELAGVGVALKFAQALVRRLGYDSRSYIERYLDLTVLGTIADVVPLVGENRTIAKFGLEALGKSKKVGIQAMLAKTGLERRKLTSHSVGYILGPRINAVGRLDDAAVALRLLTTTDRAEADEIVSRLEKHNQERQAEQLRILQEVQAQISSRDLDQTHALVLAAPGWNSGVIGIVASKVVEQYNRPAVLLSLDEDAGIASGSARSTDTFNIIEALGKCRDLLDRAGGHAYAAGLSLRLDNLPLFEDKLNRLAAEMIPVEELVPRIDVDVEISPQEVSWELLQDIGMMEPFGAGNQEPLFMSRGLELLEARRVGGDGSHLKLRLKGQGGVYLDCIGFGFGDLQPSLQVGHLLDICYNIRSNYYNGSDSLQLTAKDIRMENGA